MDTHSVHEHGDEWLNKNTTSKKKSKNCNFLIFQTKQIVVKKHRDAAHSDAHSVHEH